MNSIIAQEKRCWVCGSTENIQCHHVWGGRNRKISDKNGFTVFLCAKHHNMSDYSVHFNHDLDMMLKKVFQEKFEETHTREQFIALIDKSVL